MNDILEGTNSFAWEKTMKQNEIIKSFEMKINVTVAIHVWHVLPLAFEMGQGGLVRRR